MSDGHSQGAFRFSIKLLFVMETLKKILNVQVVLFTFYAKNNGDILKNTIIYKFQESFKLVLEQIKNDNHQVSIDNTYVSGDLVFFDFIR